MRIALRPGHAAGLWLALIALLLTPFALPPAAVARPTKGMVLSPRLATLAARPTTPAHALGLPAGGPGSLLADVSGRPLVYVHLDGVGATRLSALRAAGAQLVHISAQYNVVTAAVATRDLGRVGAVAGVARMREALAPGQRGELAAGRSAQAQPACPSGAVISEGDAALRAAEARARFGVDGAGVVVGVLADSFNVSTSSVTAAADIATGELPGPGNPCGRLTPVRVVAEPRLRSGRDEGRAMLQIVHDLAPGAALAFASAADGIYAYAENIRRLRWEAGADVIVDDFYYPEEPIFQDGPVSVAIGDVVADGAIYVTAGGNINLSDAQGRPIGSYEAPAYRPIACPILRDPASGGPLSPGPDCHDFDPGPGEDAGIAITLPPGGGLVMNFQWSEPWFGVRTDLDVYLVDEAGVVLASALAGLGPAPFEFLGYTNAGAAPQVVQLVATRFTGEAPRFKFTLGSAALAFPGPTTLEYAGSSGPDIIGPTSADHAMSAHAIAVGAAPFDDPLRPEPFSSLGPGAVYWAPAASVRPAPALPAPEVRAKPDVAATDGVRTSFYGRVALGGPRCDPAAGELCRFYGTSAAAPHVAGMAALLVERANRADVPLGGPLALRLLQASARPMRGPGAAFGAGLVDAAAALAALETALGTPAFAGPLMPDLVGVGEEEAKRRLLALGVGLDRVVVDYQNRDKLGPLFDQYPAFAVVSSLPPAGARIGGGATVVLGVRAP